MPKPRKLPQRTCLGCREVRNKRELLRVVRTPQGEVTFDPSGKLAGRGAYVCAREECLREAFRGKRLEKALRGEVSVQTVELLLADLARQVGGSS